MIDSHCHLDHEPLKNNLGEVIDRSKKIGIDKLLTICTTEISYRNILEIVKFDPKICVIYYSSYLCCFFSISMVLHRLYIY